jgi:DNA-directed RNA polymerase alpha subunit
MTALIIEVLTDGTIEPDDALAESARILARQAEVFAVSISARKPTRAAPGLTIRTRS